MLKYAYDNTKLLLEDTIGPEDLAMIQALYARRAESAEGHIEKIYAGRRDALRAELRAQVVDAEIGLEELTDRIGEILFGAHASAKAGAFMGSHYVGYGHKSIGDCGTATLFIEGVSLLAAKAIQDWPLYSGQETSTRAIDFSLSEDPKKVVGRLYDPIQEDISQRLQTNWMSFYLRSQDRVADEVRRRYPRQAEEDAAVYERAVKARVFDILRGFLPAGVTTQLSWHGNLRQIGDHLQVLKDHPLAEVRRITVGLLAMLQERYPSSGFGEVAALSGTPFGSDVWAREAWQTRTAEHTAYSALRAMRGTPPFEHTLRMRGARAFEMLIATRPRGCVLPHFLTDLGQLHFYFPLDFGSFRDIQRHRNGVCRMPELTTEYGFETWYLDQLDEVSFGEATVLLQEQDELLRDMAALGLGLEHRTLLQQYCIPLGFRVPTMLTYGLPAALYVMELRTGPSVHPTLRRAVQRKMVTPFRAQLPNIPLHADMTEDVWNLRRGTQVIEEKSMLTLPVLLDAQKTCK